MRPFGVPGLNSYRAVYGVLLILALGCVGVGVWFVAQAFAPYSEAETIGQGTSNFEEISDRFTTLAKEKGAKYAFGVLLHAKLPSSIDTHLLGHAVGDELYAQEGIKGIAVCTQDFRNACSHSIVIGAFTEYGEEALPLIREACTQAPGGTRAYTMCYHGLGHGVFAYYGYSFPETIATCKKTGTKEYFDAEYRECMSGAVMELVGGGGHDREKWVTAREKYFKKDDPLSPCLENWMPADVRPVCIIYITPQLWEAVGINLGNPEPYRFARAFEFCEVLSVDTLERDACFGGFGKEFLGLVSDRDIRNIDTLTAEQYKKAASWCNYARPEDGRDSCVARTLGSIFWGGENDPKASFTFCSVVDDARKLACYDALARNVNFFIRAKKERDELCAEFPITYRELCTAESYDPL